MSDKIESLYADNSSNNTWIRTAKTKAEYEAYKAKNIQQWYTYQEARKANSGERANKLQELKKQYKQVEDKWIQAFIDYEEIKVDIYVDDTDIKKAKDYMDKCKSELISIYNKMIPQMDVIESMNVPMITNNFSMLYEEPDNWKWDNFIISFRWSAFVAMTNIGQSSSSMKSIVVQKEWALTWDMMFNTMSSYDINITLRDQNGKIKKTYKQQWVNSYLTLPKWLVAKGDSITVDILNARWWVFGNEWAAFRDPTYPRRASFKWSRQKRTSKKQ